eukprot:TRINITY_DN4336_c0_g1_i1.p1 TRINITY_DN4336_c0_g1~~TRINITY_DN4336_c0_g1_i1.p1  ORF type:complete len:320 (+),score=61.25 TRINITY_DN4336_c0_g1_i1:140-1099(+)
MAKTRDGNPLGAVMPIIAYCLSSMSMIYTNKLVLSTYGFPYAATLLLFQSSVAVGCLVLLSAFSFIKLEPFSFETAKKWSPVTIFFGLMLYTGSKTITYLSIPVLTVFKNMTNLFIAFGDWYFFGQTVTPGIIFSFGMMTLGSILVGFTDLEFNLRGYVWMCCNCLAQTGYVLYMRQAKTTTKLSEWGMSFYNNLLCIVLMALAAVFSGELEQVADYPLLTSTGFLVAMVFGGVIGTGLSLSVFWCVSATSPTTYSMVGALNKIPITFISVVFFHVAMDWKMAVSVCVGLVSGLVYTYAKLQMRKASSSPSSRLEEGRK